MAFRYGQRHESSRRRSNEKAPLAANIPLCGRADFIVEDGRIFWDATTPIPSNEGPTPVRRWPAITMHDPETLAAIDRFDLPPWPDNLVM